MAKRTTLDWIVLVLVLIGALNWGLVAINASYNLVGMLLGTGTLATLVYALVGLSGLYMVYQVATE